MQNRHGGDIWGAARNLGIGPEDLIDFSASINPLGLSPSAKEAIRRGLNLLSAYPDPDMAELKNAFASYHGLEPKNVLPANGSTEIIYLIPRAYKPKKALIVEPAFSDYRRSLELSGCAVQGFLCHESEDFFPDLKKLFRRLKEGFELIYIANPANPAGVVLGKEEILRLADLCRRFNTTLVVDEAFSDFLEENSVKQEAAALKNIIVLRSMTKFFSLAGLRLGFAVSHREVLKRLKKLQPPWSVNTFAMVAGKAVLEDKKFLLRTQKWFEREHAFLSEGLSFMENLKRFPSAANFFLLKIRGGLDSMALKKELLKKRILIRDAQGFRGLNKKFFRLAVRSRRENRLLIEALKEVL